MKNIFGVLMFKFMNSRFKQLVLFCFVSFVFFFFWYQQGRHGAHVFNIPFLHSKIQTIYRLCRLNPSTLLNSTGNPRGRTHTTVKTRKMEHPTRKNFK